MKQKRQDTALNYSTKLSGFILETMGNDTKNLRKNTFQKNRAVSEGNELQELETTSVQQTTIVVQRIENPRRKEPPETINIIYKKQSKK